MVIIKDPLIPRSSVFIDYPQLQEYQRHIIWIENGSYHDYFKLQGLRGIAVLVYPKVMGIDYKLLALARAMQCKFLDWRIYQ